MPGGGGFKHVRRPAPTQSNPNPNPTLQRDVSKCVMGLKRCLRDRIFWLNCLYLVYSAGFLVVDIYAEVWNPSYTNLIYRNFVIVHMICAQFSIWSWDETWFHMNLYPEYLNATGSALYLWAATLYRDDYSVVIQRGMQFSEDFWTIRYLELCASGIEFVAAIGWLQLWYRMFKKEYGLQAARELCGDTDRNVCYFDPFASLRVITSSDNDDDDEDNSYEESVVLLVRDGDDKGDSSTSDQETNINMTKTTSSSRPRSRSQDNSTPSTSVPPAFTSSSSSSYPLPIAVGWTLQDPDLWANATVLVASAVYLIYNIEVLVFASDYNTSMLYYYGDAFYTINAFFYILSSMRDCDVFADVPEYNFLYILPSIREARELRRLRTRARRRSLASNTISNSTSSSSTSSSSVEMREVNRHGSSTDMEVNGDGADHDRHNTEYSETSRLINNSNSV
jgi:hypothetical protein